MTYRGIYRDGVVVLRGEVDLPNGAAVEVNPLRGAKNGRKPTRKAAPARKAGGRPTRRKPLEELAAFGMWKDRPEWKGKSTLEIVAELRQKAMGRRRG